MSEFFSMGGYAAYVWSAYAVTALVLGLNAIAPVRAERAALAHLARRQQERTS
jgi:heme exporter protein D